MLCSLLSVTVYVEILAGLSILAVFTKTIDGDTLNLVVIFKRSLCL